MAIEDFFDHTCDIFHIDKTSEEGPGYGLQTQVIRKYKEDPDIEDLSCHFSVDDENIQSSQEKPQMIADIKDTLAVSSGTDIRFNDKIVDKVHGVEYVVIKPPRDIRGNHIKAKLMMLEIQKDV